MALPAQCTKVILAKRPDPNVDDSTFQVEKVPMSSVQPLKPTDVLVKVEYVSIDPAMRGWLDDRRSYIEPVKIGATMRASGVGKVMKVHPNASGKFKAGDSVKGVFGWTDFARVNEAGLVKLDPPKGTETLDYLGPLGDVGMTAYFGLLDVAKLQKGETCVVSGAAGAVGSIVCQIAKLKGAKVIAIAGSEDKCEWLEKDLGVDKALNYKSKTFVADFKTHVGYLDVFFDNVGGAILDLALSRLKKGARIALCGAISDYGRMPKGLQGYLNLISQRASIQGFIVFDYLDRYPGAIKEMGVWMQEGKIKSRFHIEESLEKCPEHLGKLFKGVNTGKMVVHINHPESSKL